MIKRIVLYSTLFFICISWAHTTIASPEKRVFVSILPQKFFVQHISGDILAIEVMVEPGANPVTYEPKPSQMRNLSDSQAYFAIGVPFENVWLEKIAAVNPRMRIVHTDRTVTKRAMESHIDEEHSGHHEKDQPEHTGLDPHIWLSPSLVKKQVAIIHTSMIELYPEFAERFTHNYQVLNQRIDQLDNRLKTLLNDYRGRKFMVFHPSWGYFANEYGLQQVAIEIEGKQPKPAQLQQLIDYARKENIRVIFAQKQFSQKSAKIIAREIDGKVVTVDPLAEDWFANMEAVGQKFKEAMQ